jgi:hypothetical protein
MIWILLAALGVPLWLIVGALASVWWSRRVFQRLPGVFPCKARAVRDIDGSDKWGRKTARARWVHDVLFVHTGLALARFRALPVAGVEGPVSSVEGLEVKGEQPVSARLRLDDGSVVEVAAPASAAELLVGPFLAVRAEPAPEVAS